MKEETVIFSHKNKKFKLKVKKVPWWYKGIGLMFSSSKKASALLFNFKKPTRNTIFSLFIPFEFLAIWIDEKGKVIEKRKVKRGEINIFPLKKFVKLIEIPITTKYDELIKLLVVD